ncbi:MAG TPA: LPS assembly lipoprotein LptE [Burkholderiaceae bacterium]|nr:LPS assembly lipoprotein LptE [Burkholderiaceae bacterium]
MKHRRALLAALATVTLTTACGFKLRGSADIPFRSIFLGVPEASSLGYELRRNLRAGTDVRIVTDAKDADARLDVLSESRDKEVLSINSAGRAREYTLRYRLSFKVTDAKGRDYIPPTEISLSRDISFNEDALLAKESEEALLYRDMQSDMVQQILRRLSAIKVDPVEPGDALTTPVVKEPGK